MAPSPSTPETARPARDDVRATLERLILRAEEAGDDDRASSAPAGDSRAHDRDRRARAARLPRRHIIAAETIDLTADHAWARTYRSVHRRLPGGGIIVLSGGYGTGKTQIAVCLALDAIDRGVYPLYVQASDLFAASRDAIVQHVEPERNFRRRYAKPGLLIIDQLEERRATAHEDQVLFDIVNTRYNDGTATMLITNETGEQISEAWSGQIIDRLAECGGMFVCGWPSFRRGGGAQA